MILVGPFTVANGVLVNETDPSKYTPASDAVQIQNSSAFLLKAVIGGRNYFVPPFTATTVATYRADTLAILPSSPSANFGVNVQLAWLQSGEDPPIPDGPLTQATTQNLGLLSVQKLNQLVDTSNSPLNISLLPSPPTGFSYSLYSFTIYCHTGSAGGVLDYGLGPTSGSTQYLAGGAVSAGSTLTSSLTSEALVTTAINFVVNGDSSSYAEFDITLRYDLFPSPAT